MAEGFGAFNCKTYAELIGAILFERICRQAAEQLLASLTLKALERSKMNLFPDQSMMLSYPMNSVNWLSLGKVYYEKYALYNLSWSSHFMDLSSSSNLQSTTKNPSLDMFDLRHAAYGGPVAVRWNPHKLMPSSTKKAQEMTDYMAVFTSSGHFLSQFHLRQVPKAAFAENPSILSAITSANASERITFTTSKLISFEWSLGNHLFTIFEDGSIIVFNVKGECLQAVNLWKKITSSSRKASIQQVQLIHSTLVVMTTEYRFLVMENIDFFEWKAVEMPSIAYATNEVPTCFHLFAAQFTKSNQPEIFVATTKQTIYVLSLEEVMDLQLSSKISAVISRISIAPNGLFLALFTQNGLLMVLNTKFDNKVLEFDTEATSSPLQMVWCGEDAVLLYWKKVGVIMIGPYGSWLKFPYEEAVYLAPERD